VTARCEQKRKNIQSHIATKDRTQNNNKADSFRNATNCNALQHKLQRTATQTAWHCNAQYKTAGFFEMPSEHTATHYTTMQQMTTL